MDIDRFLENLDKEYKKILMALVFIFPMAYIDCWKLSGSFKSFEIIPQIILALGISFLLMAGGVVLDTIFLVFSYSGKITKSVNLPTIIMPTIPATLFVILGGFDNVWVFCSVFIGFILAIFFFFLIQISAHFLNNKYKEWRHKKNDDESQDIFTDLSQDH